ncbi:leucine-rich repeat-containing protein 15 isoform X3 [Eurytemora carolleeae]|uniref:leucine-rich repeat-containing protein 15 isoform X3 n=1 Tax=Eurytemora carolleeae TaxID=1294199 RepID=UPI000C755D7F|nr:leucine-rich repeat-containing protein 15 isoform X3 [Eurytemora carolleeae]|eukprot:XP_023343282.1 leucine-rich repeat-containing protein 15-like isoform X3 [Eurytemora affinis]
MKPGRGSKLWFLLLIIRQIIPALGLTLQSPLRSSRPSRYDDGSRSSQPSTHLPPVLFPSDEELAVHLPDWKERGTRQAEYRTKPGITLKGELKSHGEPKQKCPESSSIKPCSCKERTSGLDITCEGIGLVDLQAVTDQLKSHNQVSVQEYNGFAQIGYFKIRDCRIPKFPDYIFMGLKIVHLLVYNCEVQSLMPNSLSSLAGSLKHLVLSNNKLHEVPKMALRQLRELDHLNLNQNNITIIKEGAFWGLSKVTRLSLYDNKLKEIENGAFDGLTKLQSSPHSQVKGDLLRLNVGRNHLSEIPRDAIVSLKNLNQLDLSENKIEHIKPGVFQGMDRLDTLTLNHNYLQELGPGGFEGLSKLTSLSLDYNKINTIDPEAFKGLEEQMQSLSMTNNKLTSLPTSALRPLHQLTTLHLDDNNLHQLEEGAFQGFGEHIKNLWLQNNHISLIPLTTFDDLHSIEWLKLYNNELTTLHYELMEPVLDTLKHIDIHSNPLICDCEMRWYKKWFNAEWQEIDQDYIKATHCVDPEDGREHLISQVSLNHMYCIPAAALSSSAGVYCTWYMLTQLLVTLLYI